MIRIVESRDEIQHLMDRIGRNKVAWAEARYKVPRAACHGDHWPNRKRATQIEMDGDSSLVLAALL